MPKIGEEDWNKIENNVCFVSFLQGMPIKSKIYNNYSVLSCQHLNIYFSNIYFIFYLDTVEYNISS